MGVRRRHRRRRRAGDVDGGPRDRLLRAGCRGRTCAPALHARPVHPLHGDRGPPVPLVSIAAALTLQPALLSLFGRPGLGRAELGLPFPAFPWRRLASWVVRRRVPVLVLSAAVLVGAAIPALSLRLTPGSISGHPPSLESVRGFDLLRERVAAGAVTPTEIVIDAGSQSRDARSRAQAERCPVPRPRGAAGRERSGEPRTSTAPAATAASSRRPPRVRRAADAAFRPAPARRLTSRAAASDRRRACTSAGFRRRASTSSTARTARCPWLVLAVLVVTFFVLLRAFRSLVLPLKAVVLNVLTVRRRLRRWAWRARLRPRSTAGSRSSSSRRSSGCRWTTRSSSCRACARRGIETGDNKRAVARGLERTGRVDHGGRR